MFLVLVVLVRLMVLMFMCDASQGVILVVWPVSRLIILFGMLDVVSILLRVMVGSGCCSLVSIIMVLFVMMVGVIIDIRLSSEECCGARIVTMFVGLGVLMLKNGLVIGLRLFMIWVILFD